MLEDASLTFNGVSASLRPGFGRTHILSLAPAVSVWTCLLPGKPPTTQYLQKVTLPWDTGSQVAHLLLGFSPVAPEDWPRAVETALAIAPSLR